MADIARVNRSAVDNLVTAWILEEVQREVMVLRNVLVDECEAGGATVDQGVGIQTARRVLNSALNDQLMTIELRYLSTLHGSTGYPNC